MNPAIPETHQPPLLPAAPTAAKRWVWVLLAGAVAGLVVLYRFNPTEYSFYPACQFYQVTQLHCPGCGSLRALHQLTHGHLTAAFHSNPLLISALPLLAGWGLRRLRPQPAPAQQSPVRLKLVWLCFAVTLIFGVMRNLPGPAFAWMAP